MPTIYYLSNTDSDLSIGGAEFNKAMPRTNPSSGEIEVVLAAAGHMHAYAFSPAGDPGAIVQDSLDFSIRLDVTSGSEFINASVNVHRVNSVGAIQNSAGGSAGQYLSAPGIYTFTVSFDLSEWFSGDRLLLEIYAQNEDTEDEHSFILKVGDGDSCVIAPWSDGRRLAMID